MAKVADISVKPTEKNDGLAHFILCSCEQHGRIVFPDGRTSGEIGFKDEADLIMHYASLVNKFQSVDIFPEGKLLHISDEIEESKLPKTRTPTYNYVGKEIDTWNAAKLLQSSLDPESYHIVMDKLWHYRAYDD